MTGIVLSGATFSGSGDVTTEFFYVMASGSTSGVKSNVYMPDTLTLTGANTVDYDSKGTTNFALSLPSNTTSITTFDNGNGKVIFANTANFNVYPQYETWYDWEMQTIGDVSGTQRGDLTVRQMIVHSGSWEAGLSYWNAGFSASGLIYASGGHLNIGTKAAGTDARTAGAVYIAALGTLTTTAGTLTVSGAPNGGYSWYNPEGTFNHSNGTVAINFVGTDATHVREGNQFYNYEQTLDTASYASARVNWRGDGSAPYAFTIGNNLTLKEGAFRPSNATNTIVVSGNVVVESGGTYGYSAGDFEAAATFGSLYANSGNLYLSTGTTTINNANADSYKFRAEGNPIIVHNDGTVVLDASTNGGMYKNTGSNGKWLHNLTVKNDTSSQRAIQNVYDVFVANNLTVSGAGSDEASWDVGFYNAGDGGYTVSGLTTVINGAKLGRSVSSDSTFGKLTIGAKGWYDAPTGSFTLSDDFTIASDDTTFTHNSGTCVIAGNVELLPADFDSSETARHVFWDVSHTAGTFYLERPSAIERNYVKSGGDLVQYTKTTFGTTSAPGSLTVNSGEWKMYGYYGNPYLYGASSLYPVAITGSATTVINWDNIDNVTRGTKNHIKYIDMQVDTSTGGGGAIIEADGDAKFRDLTLTNGDTLTINNQRLETDSLLLNGIFNASSSLIVANDKLKTNSASTINSSGTSAIVSHSGSSTCRWNRGTWDNIMYNATGGEVHFDTNGNTPTNLIVAGGTLNTKGMHFNGITSTRIANGGILNNTEALTAGGIYDTTTFSNRGGLFTSSSAVEITGSAASSTDFSYINVPYNLSSLSGDATIELWINADIQANSSGGLVNGYPGTNRWQMYYETSQQVTFYSHENNKYLQFSCPAGKWQHIAITFNNSTQECNGYLNGKLVDNTNLGSGINLAVSGVNPDIGINWQNAGKTAIRTGQQMFDGRVGMFRLFNSERTAAQIKNDMFNAHGDMADTTNLAIMYQFDEGEGTSIKNVDDVGTYDATLSGVTIPNWANQGTWTGGGPIGAETDVIAGNLYIGTHSTTPTVFSSSYFPINNRKLVSASKLVSKAHMGTLDYYIATSGTNDFLSYQHLESAPIGSHSDVYILANGLKRSYFEFDSDARNEQCNILVNAGVVRIVSNSDFYTQDFDNAQGEWIRSTAYDGIIHDDGSTPHEYEPIDIMDDQDSFFDTEDLID